MLRAVLVGTAGEQIAIPVGNADQKSDHGATGGQCGDNALRPSIASGPLCKSDGRDHDAGDGAGATHADNRALQPEPWHQDEPRDQRAGDGAERIGHIDARRIAPNGGRPG